MLMFWHIGGRVTVPSPGPPSPMGPMGEWKKDFCGGPSWITGLFSAVWDFFWVDPKKVSFGAGTACPLSSVRAAATRRNFNEQRSFEKPRSGAGTFGSRRLRTFFGWTPKNSPPF
jgi:hypothetical protein